MEERTLELNVISAQYLKKVKNFGHQSCFAVAYISSSDKKASQVDKDGGFNPTWNAKLTLTCDEKLLHQGGSYITVDIYSHGPLSNRLVGTSRISLLEIGRQAAADAPPKFLSFEVRRRSGKVQGVLNVSVKVREKRIIALKSHSGKPLLGFSGSYKRLQLPAAVPMGYSQVLSPSTRSSPQSETVIPYSPRRIETITPYPPPKVSYEPSTVALTDSVYPGPPRLSSATSMSFKKRDELVIADPASGYPDAYPPRKYGPQNSAQYYGSQYAGRQQSSYYPTTHATAPYKHQAVHYSKRSRRLGRTRCRNNGNSDSRGIGMGLLGGVFGGLLLGDVIGDIF